jgi:hypothetical protein
MQPNDIRVTSFYEASDKPIRRKSVPSDATKKEAYRQRQERIRRMQAENAMKQKRKEARKEVGMGVLIGGIAFYGALRAIVFEGSGIPLLPLLFMWLLEEVYTRAFEHPFKLPKILRVLIHALASAIIAMAAILLSVIVSAVIY